MECMGNSCPFVGERADGDFVVVGTKMLPGDQHGVPGATVGIGYGEEAVIVPRAVMEEFLENWHHKTCPCPSGVC